MVDTLTDGPHACVHRGEIIRQINCNCAGNTNVYRCGMHTECMIRKLKPGLSILHFCNVCTSKSTKAIGDDHTAKELPSQ